MTIANSVAAKLTVAFVAIAMMFSVVAPAQAQTVEELQAEIAALMAQINGLQAEMGGDMSSSDVCPYTWTRSLNMGATGMDVMKLQQFLNADAATQVAATGAGSAGNETEYYGPATGAAVAKFQEMYRADILSPLGLVNSTTFFGPSTMAKANSLCITQVIEEEVEEEVEEETAGSSELGNDEGTIESVTGVSSDENNLEEGMEGGILGFEVEIEGDVEIDRIDVYAAETGGTASDDADDYFSSASLWVDGDKVAELDVDDFRQNDYSVIGTDDYRLRFSGLGLVFEDGDEPEFQVAFEVVNNLDSVDLTSGDWTAEVDSIRYVDGQGFTDSEDNIGENDTFGFDPEEMAEIDVTDSSDNPDATTLKIDDADDESDEYEVFVFEIEEQNGVDVTIEDITFQATTTGITNESLVIEEAILYQGSTELGSESVLDGGVFQFENIGLDVDGDETVELTLAMIFKGADDAGLTSDVVVQVVSIDDAEDERGNDEGDIVDTVSASSETHTLRTVVPDVTDTSFSVDRNEAGDAGVISFEFTVGAEDDDFTLNIADRAAVNGLTDDVRFTITGGDLGANATATISKISGDATDSGTNYVIADGDEATFVLDVVFDAASAAGAYRVTVDTVGGIEIDDTSTALNI